MIIAIKKVFPLAVLIGCSFHLMQSILYEESAFPMIWSHNFLQLVLPEGYIIDATNNISERALGKL